MNKCLVPHCNTLSKTRGLCQTHYTMLSKLVSAGRITYEQAQKNGKCLSDKVRGGKTYNWFLSK